jgi:hypothetical protein
VCYRETYSADHNFLKHSLRYGDLAKKAAQQLKIAERGQVDERTAVGDDQGLPDHAPSFELIDGRSVRRPILRGVDDVGDAALLQQFHERKPFQAELMGCFASGDLAICEESQDSFLPQVFR